MDTLFDKISMLISSKLYGKTGRSFTPGRNRSAQRRLQQTIYELLRTEARVGEMSRKMQEAQQALAAQEQQLAALDADVDARLLAGDEAGAAVAQQHLNQSRQRVQKAKMQFRQLHTERERQQTLRDQLEVKMTIMGLKREVLDEYIRRYQQAQKGQTSAPKWRVLDPEEL